MTDRFPLVFSTLGCPDWTFAEAVQAAVDSGYVGLEVRVLDGEIIPADLPAERRRAMKQRLFAHDLTLVALGASTRFSSPDPEERRQNVEELKRYLALANDLHTPMVRTFGGHVAEGQTMAQTIAWVAEALAQVAPEAERRGVTVLLETHDAFCRGAEVAPVLAQVDSPFVQAVWDVHHPYRMGESIGETWQLIGSYVKHVHLKDARRKPDGDWQLVLMGEGEVPNRAIIELLAANGYDGYLSVEWEKKWHPEIEEPEVALPQHARILREWFQAL